MATIEQTIGIYENQGALLTSGPSQILNYTDFQNSISGEIAVDDANTDIEWDIGETATFESQTATLIATGNAVFGVTIAVNLPFPLPDVNLTVSLSSPVLVGVVEVGSTQYVRFYNPDGTDADPAALLDGLVGDVVTALGPLLGPVELIVGPIADYVENNTLLTFDLPNTDGVDLVPCFTAGTLIATECGEVAVEALRVGDLVLTVDHGLQPIRWVGSRTLTADELAQAPNLMPIRIEPGALGSGLPWTSLTVSPQHRCLVRSKIAERMSGDPEVLVAARHLLGAPGIAEIEAPQSVTYVHLLFDRHELLWSNGAITESFYLGKQAMTAVDRDARDEILQLFPALASGLPETGPLPARPFIRGRVARRLVDRSIANRKPLFEDTARLRKPSNG
jgi:hypothetical protein